MTQPIRIVRIIARLNVGGPAIHVALLTEKLGAPDYESTLVCGTIAPTKATCSTTPRRTASSRSSCRNWGARSTRCATS